MTGTVALKRPSGAASGTEECKEEEEGYRGAERHRRHLPGARPALPKGGLPSAVCPTPATHLSIKNLRDIYLSIYLLSLRVLGVRASGFGFRVEDQRGAEDAPPQLDSPDADGGVVVEVDRVWPRPPQQHHLLSSQAFSRYV